MIITIKNKYLKKDIVISQPYNETVIPNIGDTIKLKYQAGNSNLFTDYCGIVSNRVWASDLSGVTLITVPVDLIATEVDR